MRFWVACLNIKSSVSDSQPHYSVVSLYHGTAGAVPVSYTHLMVKNDGTMTNDRRFWDVFCQATGGEESLLRPVFDGFYEQEFHGAKAACGENPLAKQAVEGLKAKGYDVILATNPIFPRVGVETRLSWVGLTLEDFSLVTSYENSTTCKPNPSYYA